jgi:hypothetical protein
MVDVIERSGLSQRQSELIADMKTSTAQLRQLTDDILDLAALQEAKFSLALAPFNLSALVTKVVRAAQGAAQASGLALELLMRDETCNVIGDSQRVQQILNNLIYNAIKFTPQGWVRVHADWQTPDSAGNVGVVVFIADSGRGIAAESLGSIFQPFQQGDESINRDFGGTGLGLALCRELCESMAGSIRVLGQDVPFGPDLLFAADDVPGLVLHVEICEDMFVPIPPSAQAALAGATVLANLSGSPITIGRAEDRKLLARSASARCLAAYVYAAAGEGESSTDLAWDGQTMIYENGRLLAESERFPKGDRRCVADVDLDLLRAERLRMGTFDDNRRRHQPGLESFRRIDFHLDPPAGDIGLRREVERFLYMLCRDAIEHPGTRAAAVKAIDEFLSARMR